MGLRGPQRMSSPRALSCWGYPVSRGVTKRSHLCGVGTCPLGPSWASGLTSPWSTDSCPELDAHGRPCRPAPTSAGGGGSLGPDSSQEAPACPLSGPDPCVTAVHTLHLDHLTCGFGVASGAADETAATPHVGGPSCPGTPCRFFLFKPKAKTITTVTPLTDHS